MLVDDFSSDDTIEVAKECCIRHIIKHDRNLGYGANQKTCYDTALILDADIIVMLHPDYQYDPKLITAIIEKILQGADIVLASRMMKGLEAVKMVCRYTSIYVIEYLQNSKISASRNIYQNIIQGIGLIERMCLSL